MSLRSFLALLAIAVVFSVSAQAQSGSAIEIDLQEQVAYLVQDGEVVLSTPISSGRAGYQTTRGSFKITEKQRQHYSNLYGKIVDARGNTLVADADADMPLPPGARFVPAPMRYFLRFNGAEGMHAGHLPGYPASHGCVRLPENNAITIFEAVEVGTPVTVFGLTPRGRVRGDSGYTMQPRRQREARERVYAPRMVSPYGYAPPRGWR